MDRIKIIRDLVIGDGSLFTPISQNAGSCIGISHADVQYEWIFWKKKKLDDLGIKLRFYQDKTPNKQGRRAWRIRTTVNQEFKRLWEDWYYIKNGISEKSYIKMLNAAPVDEDTLAILFLDNGSRQLKSTYKDFNNGKKYKIEPYMDKFRLSVGKREQAPIVAMLASFEIDSRKNREFTGEGEVTIGTNKGKQILKYILDEFCTKNRIDVFKYKYDFPISMSQVKRLSEMDCQKAICDSLNTTNNQ